MFSSKTPPEPTRWLMGELFRPVKMLKNILSGFPCFQIKTLFIFSQNMGDLATAKEMNCCSDSQPGREGENKNLSTL